LFQFYGNLPFTVGGALSLLPGLGAYDAWRLVLFASMLCGGAYAYKGASLLVGRAGDRGRTAATVAGASFMASPYLMSDVFPRGAFAETIAFNFLRACSFTLCSRFGVRASGTSWGSRLRGR
jgi:hypothetical protein